MTDVVQNLQRRFPDLEERAIRKAVTDCDGHGGRAANILQSILLEQLSDDFPYADEDMIQSVCEDCEVNGGKPSEKMRMIFDEAPRVLCPDPSNSDFASAVALSSETGPVFSYASKAAASIGSDSTDSTPVAAALAPMHLCRDHSDAGFSASFSRLDNIGPMESLDSLALEFRYNDSFQAKVAWLRSQGYVGWRRVLGDGNCFYRAIGYAMLEFFMQDSGAEGRGAASFRERLSAISLHPRLGAGPAEICAHEELLAEVSSMSRARAQQPLDALAASAIAASSRLDLALVRALRQLISDFLIANASAECFSEGLPLSVAVTALGFDSVEDFCEQIVLRMGTDAESIVLPAMAHSIAQSFRVVFLDRSEMAENMETAVPTIDYLVDGQMGGHAPSIHIQLRPGHYDILYHGGMHS